ncbi:hypothetical protein LV716_13750 [Flagellimonas sp. HMM57]|uniref:hypothetical protein n=1 Tax=unclassified Flagellimonas TaxID=2644544 RepID=UPI0013CFCC91|nr:MULTISPECIES: hypothetical protein [unclassified Flagellimonas]MBS9461437.1 hypothetical protein [Flagellimonas sp. 389]UII75312.1 hypothetical protein LV716_13750 [Flagellimonas sp. HMM57]
MNDNKSTPTFSFLTNEYSELDSSVFLLNLYLNGYNASNKPYKIDYNTLLVSYHLWEGSDLDEFCHDQALGYFLFNPLNDSAEAREAFSIEIREFLSGL